MLKDKLYKLTYHSLNITLKAIYTIIALAIIVPIVAFFLFRYFYANDFFATSTEIEFEKRLKQALNNQETEVHLKTLVDFTWKKVCVDLADYHMKLNGERPLGRFQFFDEHDVWHIGL